MVVTIICLLLFVLLFLNQDVIYPKLVLNSRPSCLTRPVGFFTAFQEKDLLLRCKRAMGSDRLAKAQGFETGLVSEFELWKLGGGFTGTWSLFVHQN